VIIITRPERQVIAPHHYDLKKDEFATTVNPLSRRAKRSGYRLSRPQVSSGTVGTLRLDDSDVQRGVQCDWHREACIRQKICSQKDDRKNALRPRRWNG
jgi:hypothetical protein